MNLPVILRIYVDNQLINVKQFSQNQIIIGSHPDVHVQLSDEFIAHFHASIEKKEGHFFLMDLGSRGGVHIENKKIIEEKISSGTSFKVGKYRIDFFVGVPKFLSHVQNINQKEMNEKPVNKEVSEKIMNNGLEPVNKKEASEKSNFSQKGTASKKSIDLKKEEQSKNDFLLSNEEPHSKPISDVYPSSTSNQDNEVNPPAVIEEKIYSHPVIQKKILDSRDVETQAEEKEDTSFHIYPVNTSNKTFAPPSAFQNLQEIIKPTKGSSIEVIVSWKERILNTYYFSEKSRVTIGSNENCDIKIPLLNISKNKHKLIDFRSTTTVYFTGEMNGSIKRKDQEERSFSELINSEGVKKTFSGYKFTLHQEEMAKIDFQGGLISIYIRYITKTSKPPLNSFLNFNSMEFTGLLLAIVLSVLIGFYMNVYTSVKKTEEIKDEPIRKAFIYMEKSKVPSIKKKKEIIKKPVKVAKPKEIKPPKLKKLKPKMKNKELKPTSRSFISRKKTKPKKTKIASEFKDKKSSNKKTVSTTKNKIKDPTKVGLLSVFGSKGTQSRLSKIYSGSGDIHNDIKSRSKKTLQDKSSTNVISNSFNKGIGDGKEKNFKTVSISKVNEKGRRNIDYGYGETALYEKSETKFVNFEGRGAKLSGFMDKNAIKKVIFKNRGAIKNCYNTALNRNPSLYGSVVLSWDIERDGSVSRAKIVSNTIKDSKMVTCILNHLRSWSFPLPPKGKVGRIARYPFVFTALK